jgi:hypothetical protein
MKNIMNHDLYHEPVVAPDGTIAIGHTRVEAAKRLGWKKITVKINEKLKNKSLLKSLMIADNKSSDFAQWDYEKLEKLIAELESEDSELLKQTLMSEEEIEAILDESIDELEAAYADTATEKQEHKDRVTTRENVEVIQLFYVPDQKENFIKMADDIMKEQKIESLSELIFNLLSAKYEES